MKLLTSTKENGLQFLILYVTLVYKVLLNERS